MSQGPVPERLISANPGLHFVPFLDFTFLRIASSNISGEGSGGAWVPSYF